MEEEIMIYQVNARSLQPYYTESEIDAKAIYYYLKKFGPPCSIHKITWAKAIYKIYHKGA